MTADERNAIIAEHSRRLTEALSDLIDGKIVLALEAVAIVAQPDKGFAVTRISLGRDDCRDLAERAARMIHTDRMPEPDIERLGEDFRKPRN